MHFPTPREWIGLNTDIPASLIAVVDVEEEFDWSKPFSRDETSVRNIEEIWRVQEIFDRFGIVPIYAVDYPVAIKDSSAEILREIQEDGRCIIGTQLHPWVNPPFEEEVNTYNSFPGNLSFQLEYEKLARLTDAISESFGQRPEVYRAGRYGFGPNTTRILESLGYKIDMSVVPYTDFSAEGGPDFSAASPKPYWFGENKKLLEIPLTCGFAGRFAAKGPDYFQLVGSKPSEALHIRGLLARAGMLDRVRLTPEGVTSKEMAAVAEQLKTDGQRIFQLSFHSSSLLPGRSDYARTEAERDQFITRIEDILEFCRDQEFEFPHLEQLYQICASAPAIPIEDSPIDRVQTNNPYLIPPQMEPERLNYWRRRAVGKLSNKHVPGPKKDVFLFSSPRSGSTFLMELVASDPSFKMVDEPLNPRKPTVWRELGLRTWHDLTLLPDREVVLKAYFEKFRANQLPELNPPLYSKGHRAETSRLVFKIIHGCEDMVSWFEQEFAGHIVLLIRHPIPTALSHRQNPRLPYLLRHEGLRAHLTTAQRGEIDNIFENGTYFEKSILDWCLQNFLWLGDIPDSWNRVRYEDLVMAPDATFLPLAERLSLQRQAGSSVDFARPSGSAIQSDQGARDLMTKSESPEARHRLAWRWLERVEPDTIDRVDRILDVFEIDGDKWASRGPANIAAKQQERMPSRSHTDAHAPDNQSRLERK